MKAIAYPLWIHSRVYLTRRLCADISQVALPHQFHIAVFSSVFTLVNQSPNVMLIFFPYYPFQLCYFVFPGFNRSYTTFTFFTQVGILLSSLNQAFKRYPGNILQLLLQFGSTGMMQFPLLTLVCCKSFSAQTTAIYLHQQNCLQPLSQRRKY